MQLRVRHVVRNVVYNSFGMVANMAVGLFLSPFVVRHLGQEAYGVWVLAISVVMYLGMLDLGMQSSVLRFVSKGHTKGDHGGASEALSAALWVRLQIAALVLILSACLSAAFPILFKVPAALAGDGRRAILIIGMTTSISMSMGVFGAVLSGLNRYDLQTFVTMVQTAVRVGGVILILRAGRGIVSVALCELVAAIIGNALLLLVARRIYPKLKVRLQRPRKEVLRQLWSYSLYAFITTIAIQLVYQTDNLVVGAAVSASAVTVYSIGNSLCRYAGLAVNAMGQTFVPAASTYEAAGDTASLVSLYKNGTRATLLVSLPILVTLIVRGSTFISLWMGPQYGPSSGRVLIILAVALFFTYANRTASAIAFGVEKHKAQAGWSLAEGVTNLVLSIILVRHFGIYGVAMGTLIPSLVVQLGFWPNYISKLVGLSAYDVIVKIWTPIFLSAVPFAAVTYAMNLYLPPRNLLVFFLQVLAALPVFLLTVGLIFRVYVRDQILPRIHTFFASSAA